MTTKIAVSLPDEQVEAARAAVADGRAASVSAYVSEALSRRSAEEELLQLLDEDDARSPSTAEHRDWARRALGTDPQSPSPRSTGKAPRTGRSAATGRHAGKADEPATHRLSGSTEAEGGSMGSRRG